MRQLSLALVLIASFGLVTSCDFFKVNQTKRLVKYLYVRDTDTWDQVTEKIVKNGYFDKVEALKQAIAKQDSLINNKPRVGRFLYRTSLVDNLDSLVHFLKTEPENLVRITFNNLQRKEELAGIMGRFFMYDSLEYLNTFNDTAFLRPHGLNAETFMTSMIPNTYLFRWQMNPQNFVKRMISESRLVWTPERKAKSKKLGFTLAESYILASIVQKETHKDDEKPRMAGVYLKRAKTKGWKLQADPTVVFAKNVPSALALSEEDYKLNSPYNTYLYPGLPPGPICMVNLNTLDAVLNAEKNNFWYFCADPQPTGYHRFTTTFNSHKKNSNDYRKARGLKSR
jgi:UPF0755 protein